MMWAWLLLILAWWRSRFNHEVELPIGIEVEIDKYD